MNSFIKWVGGKRLLRKQILAAFPEKMSCYVEVFGGAGWVLFAQEKAAETEVYNDINSELVNLFRCVKYHAEALQEELRWCLVSREQFLQAKEERNLPYLTDIQRAARFFVLVKCSFGAKLGEFSGKRVSLNSTIQELAVFKERLRSTIIECQDFEEIIRHYDGENTLFYADPPYYGGEGYYGGQFREEDHLRLKAALDGVKGRFLLTYNDCPFIRELYRDYRVVPIERQNNMTASSTNQRYREIMVKNYE